MLRCRGKVLPRFCMLWEFSPGKGTAVLHAAAPATTWNVSNSELRQGVKGLVLL